MKIAVDLDDTIISQYDEVLKILNERHGLNIDYNKVAYWNWTQDNYEEITLEEILDIVYNFRPQYCKPTDPKIAKYFKKIYEKHDIDIVTARWGYDFLEEDIHEALYKLDLYYDHVVLCGRKNKQHMGYDLLVDDNPNLANGMIGMESPYLIVFDRPWNWSIECEKHPTFFRAKDWKQVYNVIRSL